MGNIMFKSQRPKTTVVKSGHGGVRAPRGFTLLEVMVVVVILAIAAGMAVPMLSAGGATRLQAAAEMVAADLDYVKSMAISRGVQYRMTFDVAGNAYQVEDPNGVIGHPINKGQPFVFDFDDGRLSGVQITSADFDGAGQNEVAFDSIGSPYNAAGAPLDSGVLTLRMGDWTRTVRVEPVTGVISVGD